MDRNAEFDQFADNYEKILEAPCALSGESPDFYAEQRVLWCRDKLRRLLPVATVLDFGCGIGGSFSHFFELLGCTTVIGIDPSVKSLRVAKGRYPRYNIRLATPRDFVPNADLPLGFCNGVFHHIPPAERFEALAYVRACLADDGIFAFWENNPWNPVVVYGMSTNEFDRGAQTISPRAATRLIEAAGFRIDSLDFCSFFPHFARRLRPLEKHLRWLPAGAQYLVLARKIGPATART